MGLLFRLLRRFFRRKPKRQSRQWTATPPVSAPPVKSARVRNPPDQNKVWKKKALNAVSVAKLVEVFPTAKIVRILDGDSVVVVNEHQEFEVRLDSIDCPEAGQIWGDKAKYGLSEMVNNREVRVEHHGQDPYGRCLATLYVQQSSLEGWTNVNETMVMLGHAWVMQKFYDHLPFDRQKRLERLERWARWRKMGLWREVNPVPPWEWRRLNEGEQG